jgi:hypothetical protein
MLRIQAILECLAIILSVTAAYRVGEAVDTDIRMGSILTDALRSQMPMFGIPSTARFQFEETIPSFSLQFEDGLRGIPTVPLVNSKQQALGRLQVTFVYSKSGAGAIHTVISQAEYGSNLDSSESFLVDYQWIEEEQVQLTAGKGVMFLAVFVVSIVFLISLCGFLDQRVSSAVNRRSSNRNESYAVQKKW